MTTLELFHLAFAAILVPVVVWSLWRRTSPRDDAITQMTDRRAKAKHGRRATDL